MTEAGVGEVITNYHANKCIPPSRPGKLDTITGQQEIIKQYVQQTKVVKDKNPRFNPTRELIDIEVLSDYYAKGYREK
ncbi:hypothetical protein DPMN_170285 [Dreissena polymorpha]|uniref:Uncharacterized protein n=1 Tax=Dreissena polymorpha TaxID=45954 RepID=A0A9D4IEF6_DREPO|nr:hypothetical protein DPMN_170285 [Dreissena polymorpha]